MTADEYLEMAQLRAEVERLTAENERVIAKLAQMQDEQRWIPVTERLPEDDERVLVVHRNEVTIARYEPSPTRAYPFYCGALCSVIKVTHWKPLPAAPEGY